ncbi:hypothetical protein ZIOFF_011169 [Zingiber officinale]|uniref:Uncharacterized protein n=2 Tax=Zingiber officinale TaxID=94328 RepID=A0A8J5LZA1_ZINOF|nr:hypothetical protein ZIOFF_011169 [Zingiber officinale]
MAAIPCHRGWPTPETKKEGCVKDEVGEKKGKMPADLRVPCVEDFQQQLLRWQQVVLQSNTCGGFGLRSGTPHVVICWNQLGDTQGVSPIVITTIVYYILPQAVIIKSIQWRQRCSGRDEHAHVRNSERLSRRRVFRIRGFDSEVMSRQQVIGPNMAKVFPLTVGLMIPAGAILREEETEPEIGFPSGIELRHESPSMIIILCPPSSASDHLHSYRVELFVMGRQACCDKEGLKRGPWTTEEDEKLIDYIQKHGQGNWRTLPKKAGLARCGKSCRLRWTNYLRPDIKRGRFSFEEEETIIHLHSMLGNKWSAIAARLPGRTDNEIKNYWNTHIRKRLLKMGIDPVTHAPRLDLLFAAPPFCNSLQSNSLLGLDHDLLLMATNLLSSQSQNSNTVILDQTPLQEQQLQYQSHDQLLDAAQIMQANMSQNPWQEIITQDNYLHECSSWMPTAAMGVNYESLGPSPWPQLGN